MDLLSRLVSIGAGGLNEINPAWDLSYAVFKGSPVNYTSVGTQETLPEAIFFKPDGTKLYVAGSSGDDVNEYDLNVAWDLSTASYLQNFSVSAQETTPTGLFFKPDGTKMYVVGNIGDNVNEYTLSTAWDISSASYLQSFSVATQDTSPQDIYFKSDGTTMYIIGNTGDSVYQYSLSSAWDVSTASYVQSFSVSAQETFPQGLFFKNDGSKMYVLGGIGTDVNEYNLSTAWDISTAVYSTRRSVSAEQSTPRGLFFTPDGATMFIAGWVNAKIIKYDLGTAWSVLTAVFSFPSTEYFYVGGQETSPGGLFFKPDGTKMYITGIAGDDVNEYDLSSPWDISTASYLQSFSVAAQEASPEGVFFKPDGTKMYIVGTSGDDVNEYDLSSPWDVSTASYLQSFSVATQETAPRDLFIRDDGTKLYVTGSNSDSVHEYSISSPWDISTASYTQSFSVATQDNEPFGISFKDNGTQMYIVGNQRDSVFQYSLSTPWNIGTASYTQSLNVSVNLGYPTALFFKPDGLKLFILGLSSDAVWAYTFEV